MIIWRFLVGAFLKKIVDYSHGFSSVFFQKTLTKSNDYSQLFSLKSFLRPPKVTKIVVPKVLQNFEKTPKCTCWFKELNQKGFPRNIQYRTRPKGLDFFGTVRLLFKFFSTKVSRFDFFWSFAPEWRLKNHKESSLSVFSEL